MKLIINYQPAKFQIPQLSEANCTEVGIRHPKKHYDVIMTSLQNIWLSKLHILWNLIEAASLLNFIGLGFLDQILRGLVENTRSPDLRALKSPALSGKNNPGSLQIAFLNNVLSKLKFLIKKTKIVFKLMLRWDSVIKTLRVVASPVLSTESTLHIFSHKPLHR